MRRSFRFALVLAAGSAEIFAAAAVAEEGETPTSPPATTSSPETPAPAEPRAGAETRPPTDAKEPNGAAAKVLDRTEIQGVLGRQVRSRTGEDMGRIVEVIVERAGGQPRAVVIDFGGFLGVGTRKIAVDWNVLQFATEQGSERVTLDLTRDQVKAAPEYREGRPIVVLTRSSPTEPVPQ